MLGGGKLAGIDLNIGGGGLLDIDIDLGLINASLSRTNYSARNIFAVQRSGSQLTVYVY